MFSNWMLWSNEFNPENFNTLAITLKWHASKQELHSWEISVHQSPQGNMHKLFDCMKTPLKHFLACLTFHRKEIWLCDLHKRTNLRSAPINLLYVTHFRKLHFYDKIEFGMTNWGKNEQFGEIFENQKFQKKYPMVNHCRCPSFKPHKEFMIRPGVEITVSCWRKPTENLSLAGQKEIP